MDRRFGLVLLWAVFAVAAVGVGFAAAGLVSDPLTGVRAAPMGQVTGTGSPSPPTTDGPTAPEASPSSAATQSGSQAPGRSVTRSISTPGGLVSATCADGRVRLGASPALGWEIDDLDAGLRRNGRVRFEGSDDRDGRVEVRAQCTETGLPTFELEDRSVEDSGAEFEDD